MGTHTGLARTWRCCTPSARRSTEEGIAAIWISTVGGSNYRAAEFVGTSGTKNLLYRYRVKNTDSDDDGFLVGGAGLIDAAITSLTGAPVNTGVTELPAGNGHKIDGSTTGCSLEWCADLVMERDSDLLGYGYYPADPTNPLGDISNRVVTYLGAKYLVIGLILRDNGDLEITFDREVPRDMLDTAQLQIGADRYFPFADQEMDHATINLVYWRGVNLPWLAGNTVRVHLRDSVLVSNRSSTTSTSSIVANRVTTAQAQTFTTGAHSGGYELKTLGVELAAPSGTIPAVAIHSDNKGSPGAILQALDNPPTIPTSTTGSDFDGTNLFLAACLRNNVLNDNRLQRSKSFRMWIQ